MKLNTPGAVTIRMRCIACNNFPRAALFEQDIDEWWCRNCGHREPMTAARTLDAWMWTPEQWREIADCSRKSVACRDKARINREMHRLSGARWLMSDARSAERSARWFERRVVGLLRCWAPEVCGGAA